MIYLCAIMKTDSQKTKMTKQSNQGLFNNKLIFHYILLDAQQLQFEGAFLLILFVHFWYYLLLSYNIKVFYRQLQGPINSIKLYPVM